MPVRNAGPLLFGTLLLAGCGGGGGDTVVIGVAGPFSQPRGVSMKAGAELARDEINKAGGVDGKPIELVFHPRQVLSIIGGVNSDCKSPKHLRS